MEICYGSAVSSCFQISPSIQAAGFTLLALSSIARPQAMNWNLEYPSADWPNRGSAAQEKKLQFGAIGIRLDLPRRAFAEIEAAFLIRPVFPSAPSFGVIAMTTEREVAQKYGPALSLACCIVDMQPLPQVGETWRVDADVVDVHLERTVLPSLSEFSFEVEVTPELLLDAYRVAHQKQSLHQPDVWLTKVEHYLIDVRPQRPARFETSDNDLLQLVRRLDRMFERGYQPRERWVLAYIGLYWFPMIAPDESMEFHRGEVHGLRMALDFFETVFANETGNDLALLGVVLVAMAGSVAECCLGRTPRFASVAPAETSAEIPGKLREHSPDPLRQDEGDIRALAARSDHRRSSQHSRFFPGERRIALEGAAAFFITSGESPSFYQGLLYGLRLSRKALLLFQDNIFEQPDTRVQHWEEGLFRLCTFAAKNRQDAVSRQQEAS